MLENALLLIAVLALTGVLGALWRAREGRARAVSSELVLDAASLGAPLAPGVTLLQLSSATCASCPPTARALAEVAARHEGVGVVELRVEERLELVRALDVTRTPTVLALDASGRVLARASGGMRRAQVDALLERCLEPLALR